MEIDYFFFMWIGYSVISVGIIVKCYMLCFIYSCYMRFFTICLGYMLMFCSFNFLVPQVLVSVYLLMKKGSSVISRLLFIESFVYLFLVLLEFRCMTLFSEHNLIV